MSTPRRSTDERIADALERIADVHDIAVGHWQRIEERDVARLASLAELESDKRMHRLNTDLADLIAAALKGNP